MTEHAQKTMIYEVFDDLLFLEEKFVFLFKLFLHLLHLFLHLEDTHVLHNLVLHITICLCIHLAEGRSATKYLGTNILNLHL